jgi:hypothetical protein
MRRRCISQIDVSDSEALGAEHVPNTFHFVMKACEQKLNRALETKQQAGNHDL